MSWICPKCETENPDRLKVCEVCDSPREISPVDKMKERLKKKYSDPAYKSFIRYHYSLLDSADKGDVNAQYQVGEWFFSRGNAGSEDDYSKIAVFWYKKAAMRGHIDSQFKLALCYEEGRGVIQVKDEAIKWYKKAASEGDQKALHKYIKLKYSNKVYENIIRYRIGLLSAADAGDHNSQYKLGEWFSSHHTLSAYREEAVAWYTKAAKSGHVGAMYKLGICYETGWGVYLFYNQAIEWYKKAAKLGNKEACLKLGESYLYGKTVTKDVAEAVKWYEKVGKDISGADLCNIGFSYDIGDGIQMNKSKAVEYYKKAAEKGYAVAQYNLGVCYENGSGVTKNDSIAELWYKRAISQGHKQAQIALDNLNNRRIQTRPSDGNSDFWEIVIGVIGYLFFNLVVILILGGISKTLNSWGINIPEEYQQYLQYVNLDTSPLSAIIIGSIVSFVLFILYLNNND